MWLVLTLLLPLAVSLGYGVEPGCEDWTVVSSSSGGVCCTRCKPGPLRVKRFCTAASDTVCECVDGFQCGDGVCSYCIRQCGKGEEPTRDRDCRRCPEGTFNSQIHQHCVKWSNSCPSPDQQIVAKGTAVSDIVCADPVAQTELPPKTNRTDAGMMLVIGIICACLIIGTATPLCVKMHLKKEQTVKMPLGPVEDPAEQGSHSSLLSDDKPFELVV
ncbi:Tumor necrosis factor receptor superfamily member 9 [Bagarius yarrelli]|uniref:Tumor necrosis factor receptor superfamily member 9 n=1 Tax=Bagarius yarrelli TaxID=175774 RepID=A0A556V4H1_BAGYA|nr:Tumor necrosis factor receptor superfamily member 9 [Bagarius yarrelli]